MADVLHVRDTVVLDGTIQTLLAGVAAGQTLRIAARVIVHPSNVNLELHGQNLVLVCDTYNGAGGILDASGLTMANKTAAAQGTPGPAGLVGVATNTGVGNRDGGPGGPAGSGNPGAGGGTVRLLCKTLNGLHVNATGQAGGAGGTGGSGGKGGNGHKTRGQDGRPDIIEGTAGGNGGPGGRGGQGGPGGHVIVSTIGTVAAPVLEVGGGPGGAAGAGGAGGAAGTFGSGKGQHGPAGAQGLTGTAGSAQVLTIGEDAFWAQALTALGAGAADWAAYRLSVGEYLYRTYIPGVSDRGSNLSSAVTEFEAVLRLTPAHAEATRLRNQIWNNQNILGLSQDLDLLPQFDQYIQAYTAFGNLISVFHLAGQTEILSAVDLDASKRILDFHRQSTVDLIAATQDDLALAKAEQKDAADAVDEAKKKLADINTQIQAAQEEMNHHSFSIGDIIGVVGEVATAVGSVIAIIPSGGASLAVLVPDIIALTKSAVDITKPAVAELFKQDNKDVAKVKDAYGKVKKDATDLVNDAKVVINFVNLIQKVAAGSTPDNAKYVALVQRGAELIHAELLSERQATEASMRVDAVTARLSRATDLLHQVETSIASLSADAATLRHAGLSAIRAAQLKLDPLLGFGFRAQRSVEIYTLKPEAQNLFLDAGFIHPDPERDYQAGSLTDAQLISLYTDAWARLLQPTVMESDYLSYFDQPLSTDSRRLSFADPDLLQNFRNAHSMQFNIEITDLPADHLEAKIQSVFIALVGAASNSGIISCEVKHGNRYTQKKADGSLSHQLLLPRTSTEPARIARLELAGVDFHSDPPLTAPRSLAFWGRGVGGQWEVSIPQSEFDLQHPDLTALSEIEVWLGYQFKH